MSAMIRPLGVRAASVIACAPMVVRGSTGAVMAWTPPGVTSRIMALFWQS
jgi:hypothetical protein